MGSEAHVVVHGGRATALELAERRLRDLECRWSRFDPGSELSRLNDRAGVPTAVTPETARLLALAVAGWSWTGGRFDPTTGVALASAGYDRTFDELVARGSTSAGGHVGATPAPGLAGMSVVASLGVAMIPAGASIDPGGIGKGLAADLVADELVADGAAGALVSVGGDLCAAGRCPGGGWEVDVDLGDGPGRLRLVAGAVATSSVLRRRWQTVAGSAHHVIDPRTGRPTRGRALACTVVAGAAWWAEVLATALLVAWDEEHPGDVAAELLGDAAAVVLTATGDRIRLGAHQVHLDGVVAA
jgi:thiamine biosynthesis lipoprotein